MKRLWAIPLAAVACLAVAAGATISSPDGLFRQRLREARKRFGPPPAKKPVVHVRRIKPQTTASAESRHRVAHHGPAAKKPVRIAHRVTKPLKRIARATPPRVKPAVKITRVPTPPRKPTRVAAYHSPPPRPPAEEEPVVALVPKGPDKPVVEVSFEPRMPGKMMPEDTGDILFSTWPHGLKVYFEFERGETSSTRGVLIKGLDPQELHVRAFAPSLGLEIETTVAIRAGQMTQAQFFFPDRPRQAPTGDSGSSNRRTAE